MNPGVAGRNAGGRTYLARTDQQRAALDAFREQLVALLPRLRRLARGFARVPADADDLVQLALERALQRWLQWQPGTRLDSWVFGIMRNAWLDELRTRRRRGEVLLAEEAGAGGGAPGGGRPPGG